MLLRFALSHHFTVASTDSGVFQRVCCLQPVHGCLHTAMLGQCVQQRVPCRAPSLVSQRSMGFPHRACGMDRLPWGQRVGSQGFSHSSAFSIHPLPLPEQYSPEVLLPLSADSGGLEGDIPTTKVSCTWRGLQALYRVAVNVHFI